MRRFAELMLFLTTFLWAGTFVAVKIGLDDISPIFYVAVRFAVAAILFFAIFSRKLRELESSTIRRGVILGLFLFFGFVFSTVGLKLTTASKSGFITGMLVVFTPIAQVVIERRAPKLGNIIGVILVSMGLWFLTSPTGSEFNLGDGLTLIAAVIYSLYIVYLDIFSKQHDVVQLTFLQLVTTAVMAFVTASLFEPISFALTKLSLASLAYASLLATVVTTYVQTRYQKETTPTRAAIIFSLEPVIAAWLAYIFLNEILGVLGILGGGLIVVGLIISELSDMFKKIPLWFGLPVPEESE